MPKKKKVQDVAQVAEVTGFNLMYNPATRQLNSATCRVCGHIFLAGFVSSLPITERMTDHYRLMHQTKKVKKETK